MNAYVSTKIVKAEPASLHDSLRRQGKEVVETSGDPPGWHIVYPDGYESWCPDAEFRRVYRLISTQEAALLS